MKDNFEACLALTLKYEGGYVNHPRDPGGPTNLGITIATLSDELGRAATIAEVRNLTRMTAASIYRKKYWNLIAGDALPSGVDALLFDIAVNSGPVRALQWHRQVLELSPLLRIRALDARRRSFYSALPTFSVFGHGWMARENDILAHAIAMVGASKNATSTPAEVAIPVESRLVQDRSLNMLGYRTYIASGLVAAGGLIAQTDWIAFMQNPQAGLVALGSAGLMAFMRSITRTPPGLIH